jgi:hypothetical protein
VLQLNAETQRFGELLALPSSDIKYSGGGGQIKKMRLFSLSLFLSLSLSLSLYVSLSLSSAPVTTHGPYLSRLSTNPSIMF